MADADVQRVLATQGLEQLVYIIRHGEKPDEGNERQHGDEIEGNICKSSLMPRGWQRAGALIHLFADCARGGFYPPSVQLFEMLLAGDSETPIKTS